MFPLLLGDEQRCCARERSFYNLNKPSSLAGYIPHLPQGEGAFLFLNGKELKPPLLYPFF